MKKIFALLLAAVMVCTLLAGCGGGATSSDVLSNVSSAVSETGSNAETSSKAETSSTTIGGVFLAPEVKNLPSVWTKARPTISWTTLKGGATARVIVETADGKVFIDKGGITGTSYTLEKDLKSGTTYTLKVLYQRNGEEAPMAGITKKGKEIFCNIKTSSGSTDGEKAVVTMEQIVKKIKNSTDYQIMMVGDSLTYGTGSRTDYPTTDDPSPDNEKTYVAVFARLLGEKLPNKTILRYDGNDIKTKVIDGVTTRYIASYDAPVTVQTGSAGKITVVRSGIGGNTVARLLRRKADFVGKAVANKAADLFIIKSGINDALHHDDPVEGQKYVTAETYKQQLNSLLTEIYKANPNADVILMTPTVNDDHTKKTTSQLDPYAAKMKEVAADWGIPVIDMHKLWMDHIDPNAKNYGLGDWLTDKPGDLCHPSPKGHEEIAKEIIRSIFG